MASLVIGVQVGLSNSTPQTHNKSAVLLNTQSLFQDVYAPATCSLSIQPANHTQAETPLVTADSSAHLCARRAWQGLLLTQLSNTPGISEKSLIYAEGKLLYDV